MNLKGMFQQKSLGIKFALFLAITFISGIIFSVISYVLLPSLFNVSFFSLQSFLSDYSNQEAVNALKFLQLFSSIGLFIISPLLFSYLTYFNLNLNWQLNRRTILLGIVIMFLLNPLILFLYQWNQELVLPDIFLTIEQWMKATEEKAMKLTEAFLRMENFNDLLIKNLSELDLTHLNRVNIKGGEPLMNTDMLVALRYFDEINILHKLEIHMDTSGAVIIDKTINETIALLCKAKRIMFGLSVDGPDEVTTYIRYSPKNMASLDNMRNFISVFEKNNISFSVSPTIMVYNIFSLDKLVEWWLYNITPAFKHLNLDIFLYNLSFRRF